MEWKTKPRQAPKVAEQTITKASSGIACSPVWPLTIRSNEGRGSPEIAEIEDGHSDDDAEDEAEDSEDEHGGS
jgi:hypothetical protein